MIEYRTKDGDMADQIAMRVTGGGLSLDALYASNPGLAAFGPVLPSGIVIALPMGATERQSGTAQVKKVVRLWGAE